MTVQKKRLLVASMLLSLYLSVSIPYFLMEASSLEGHPVFGAIYLYLVIFHSGVFLVGLIFQWLGFGFSKRGFVTLATLLFILSGFLFFPSLLVIIPLAILNLILNRK
jgi:hypothetical protein